MMNICVFGDSIVWGAYDPRGGGWVSRFQENAEKGDKIRVYKLGVCGETTGSLLKHFTAKAKKYDPQLIIFSVGTNDSSSAGRFFNNVLQLCVQAKKFTPKIVFLGLFSLNKRKNILRFASGFNSIMKERNDLIMTVCRENKVLFIPLAEIIGPKDLVDGLHPGTAGHEKIYQEVIKNLPLINPKEK